MALGLKYKNEESILKKWNWPHHLEFPLLKQWES